jgi:sigma-B regulation protein RsbU (phosphoserine phosphatase)
VDSLKGYIELEATRYDEELRLGKQIQLSSLPSKVAYLRRHEFDIYGNMVTAKQVGGDFYDYFMLSDQKVAFMIADVSGKGIPAALFMMKTKSVLKALAENGLSVEDIFERANNRICEGNETDTFVTAWMGVCDLATGKLDYVNAGHNPPLARINGKYQYLDMKRDLVLGAMAGIPYKKQTIQLSPRDVIFLYTDGITEAESEPDCFFGEKRLLDLLNNGVTTRDPEFICKAVAEGVSAFVGDHDQSDDMTMVCFSYYGDSKDSHFEFEPTAEAVGDLCNRVSETLEESGLNLVMVNKVNLIVEEAAANIAFHAYEKKKGVGKLDVSLSEAQIVLTFFDSGPAFNPLAKEDPDIHLSAEERPIGGLGIFMIKKLADKVYYSYQERQNILTVIINR